MHQLTVPHIEPFGDSAIDRYFQWVDRLLYLVIRNTLVLPLVWLLKIPLYVLLIWCANELMKNEKCGFCEDAKMRNNYVNARKQMMKNIDIFTSITVLPKSPLNYRRDQLQMAQEYWEDKQKKGDDYYTKFLEKVAKKYSSV